MRQFNVSGPCRPEIHYMLPALRRLPSLKDLIEAQCDFAIRARPDSGKTTAALGLARFLTLEGRFATVSLSLSTAAAFSNDIGGAETALLNAWQRAARRQLPPELVPPPFLEAPPGCRIGTALEQWAAASPRPLVVILDDWEMLQGDALVSIVGQLQEGCSGRPGAFPWSIGLVGLEEGAANGGRESAALNSGRRLPSLKLESVRLPDFNHDEIEVLCAQHTADTGQLFRREAVDRLFELTGGRPLAVNSIARYIVQTLLKDTTLPVGAGHVELASEFAFERWEEGSRASFESSVSGDAEPSGRRGAPDPEREAVFQRKGQLTPDAARSPEESAPRARAARSPAPAVALETGSAESFMAEDALFDPLSRAREGSASNGETLPEAWLRSDGRLDTDRLLEAFLVFWRRLGSPLQRTTPHIIFRTFLQRVVQGSAALEREYFSGRGAIDVMLRYGGEVLPIQLRVWRDGERDPLSESLQQLDQYLVDADIVSGWIIIFDRRMAARPLLERTSTSLINSLSRRRVRLIRA